MLTKVTLDMVHMEIDMFLRLAVDSTLYLAGGEFPDGSASREMWRYDPCFDSWMEMAPMNVARSELGRAVRVCLVTTVEQSVPSPYIPVKYLI